MMPRPWSVLLAGCLLAGAAGATELPGAHLESLLALARAGHPEWAAMRQEAQAAQERIEQAQALPDPRLRMEWQDITRMGTQAPALWPADVGSTRYTLSQELPWWGTRGLRQAQAKASAQAAESAAQATWADIALRIKLGYAQWVLLWHSQQGIAESMALLEHLEHMAQVRYAAGLAPQQDALRARAELIALQTEQLGLQGEMRQTQARLNGLVARPFDAPLAEPQDSHRGPLAEGWDPAALEARLRQRNPQLAAEEARVQAANWGQALVHQGRYPSLTVGVAPTQFQGEIKTWDLMLEMNIPLWQGNRRAQEREAAALLQAAQARRDASDQQLRAELGEQWAALQSALQTEAHLARSLVVQTELALEAAQVGYEAGRLDFATVLDALRQVRQARHSRQKAQAEAQSRQAQLERLLGEDL